jgi:hypothetical protein
MAEWGFSDAASAEAFLRKRQHNNMGKTRQRREVKLRDPMRRLDRVLSTRTGHTDHVTAAPLPSRAPPPLYLATKPAEVERAPAPSVGGRGAGGGGARLPPMVGTATIHTLELSSSNGRGRGSRVA